MDSIPALTGSFTNNSSFGSSGQMTSSTSGSNVVPVPAVLANAGSGTFVPPMQTAPNATASLGIEPTNNNSQQAGNNTARVKCALTPLKSNTFNSSGKGGSNSQNDDAQLLAMLEGAAPIPKLKKKKKASRTYLTAENNALYEALALACSMLSITDRNAMLEKVKGQKKKKQQPQDHDTSFVCAMPDDLQAMCGGGSKNILKTIDVHRLQSRILELDAENGGHLAEPSAPRNRHIDEAPLRKSSTAVMGDFLSGTKVVTLPAGPAFNPHNEVMDKLIESSDEDDENAAVKASFRFGGDVPPKSRGGDPFTDTITAEGGRITTHKPFDFGFGTGSFKAKHQPFPASSTITPTEPALDQFHHDDEAMNKPASEFVQPVSPIPAPTGLNWRRRRRFTATNSPSCSLGQGMSPSIARPGAPIIELQDSIAKRRQSHKSSRGSKKKNNKKAKKRHSHKDDGHLPIARRVSFAGGDADDDDDDMSPCAQPPAATNGTEEHRQSFSTKNILPAVGTPFCHPGMEGGAFDGMPGESTTTNMILEGLDAEDTSSPRRVRNLLKGSNLPSAPSHDEFSSPHSNDGGVTNSSVSHSSAERHAGSDGGDSISPPQHGAVVPLVGPPPPAPVAPCEPMGPPGAGLRPMESFTRRAVV